MPKSELVIQKSNSISWYDISNLQAALIAAGAGLIIYLSKALAVVSLKNAKNEIKDEIEELLKEQNKKNNDKFQEISEKFIIYREKKHSLENDNIAKNEVIKMCNEALDKANIIINKADEK